MWCCTVFFPVQQWEYRSLSKVPEKVRVELWHKSKWPGRSHVLGSFEKSWTEWIGLADSARGEQVRFLLDGTIVDAQGTHTAPSLCILVHPVKQLDVETARTEIDATKTVTTELDPSVCQATVVKRLNTIVEKIKAIDDLVDTASKVRLVTPSARSGS